MPKYLITLIESEDFYAEAGEGAAVDLGGGVEHGRSLLFVAPEISRPPRT